MPSNNHLSDRLTQAGQRAAGRTGATPPPLDSVRVEVARRQRSQRTLAGVATALALVAIVPLAAFFLTSGDDVGVVTAASDAEAAALAEPASQATTTTTEAAATPLDDPDSVVAQDLDFGGDLDENVDVQIQIGDRSYSLEVIVDDSAAGRAADAEAAAEETRVIGDNTVWLRGVDGQTEASALVDDGVFAAATGPTEEVVDALDELGELAEAASSFFDGDSNLEGLLGDDFDAESFLGPDFNIERFLGPDFDPQQFFEDGDLPVDPEQFFGPDSELDLDQFFGDDFDPQQFFNDGALPFDFEDFGEGGLDLGELSEQFEALQECFGPALEQAEATGTFTFPDCEPSTTT